MYHSYSIVRSYSAARYHRCFIPTRCFAHRSLRFRAEPPVNNPKYLQQAGGEEEVKEEQKRVAVSSARSAVGGNGVLDVSKQSLTQLPTTTLEELQHEAYNEDEDRYYTLGSKVKTLKASQNR